MQALRLLAFETATEACSVAILDGSHVLQRFEIIPQKHSDLILSFIDDLLKQASLTLSKFDAIAFGAGPGAFMGVRIAAAVAQSLAFAVDLPVIPISTLQILAQTAYIETGAEKIIAGWDARIGEIYSGTYEVQNQIMINVKEETLSAPQTLEKPTGNNWLAAGNAWHVYADSFPKGFLAEFNEIRADIFPHASAMLPIAQHLFQEGKILSAENALPTYLRNQIVK